MKTQKKFFLLKNLIAYSSVFYSFVVVTFQTWQDTRNIIKSKAAAIKRHLGGTGGGPSCSIELNEIQIETLPLLSQALISGHSESLESIVEFVFDGTTDDVITGK